MCKTFDILGLQKLDNTRVLNIGRFSIMSLWAASIFGGDIGVETTLHGAALMKRRPTRVIKSSQIGKQRQESLFILLCAL